MPVPATKLIETELIEVFSSIQGEGLLVGYRQIFIRFPGCNLDCAYCDTDFAARDFCTIEELPGSDSKNQLKNPVSVEQLLEVLSHWCRVTPGLHHSFSLTGGEPLLHAELLQQWLPDLRKLLPVYLETNGILYQQLELLLPHLDWISMDIKLASVSGERTDWSAHRKFLQLAQQTNCYVKIVVGEQTTDAEIVTAAGLVHNISSDIPLILQPMTRDGRPAVEASRLLSMQRSAAAEHPGVRVIPQTHVFLGVE